MKKIAVWKVVLLTTITGWLYAIFWAGRNRDYINKHTSVAQKVPHWAWLIIMPVAMSLGFGLMITFIILGNIGVISPDTTVLWMAISLLATSLIMIAIGFWWLWYFGKAFETITQGRINRLVSLLLYIFIGPYVIAFQQYYINRLDQNQKGEIYKVSRRLTIWVVILGVLSVVSLIFSIPDTMASLNDIKVDMTQGQPVQPVQEVQEVQEEQEAVQRLEAEYNSCTEKLDADYPDEYIAPEQEATYQADYDHCDALYAEYEKAYNAY